MIDNTIIPVKFFNLFEKELKERIQEEGRLLEFREGEHILDIGNYIKTIPIILEGTIRVIREDDEGHEIFLYYVDSGQTCAMSLTCCMQDQKSKIRAIAEETVKLIALPVKYMDEWMLTYPTWKNFVMNTYQLRFEELLRTIDLIAFHNMDERLIDYLEQKAKVHKSRDISITHQEIAFELNSSREAVSRLLKALEKRGEVKLHRNRIELLE